MPKSKNSTPTKGRCTCLQQYSILPLWDPKEESDNPVRTPLRSFQSILPKVYGRVQAPWEMNQVFTYRNHYRLRAIVYTSTYLNKLHGKKSRHDTQNWYQRIQESYTISLLSAAARSECLYDLTSAFKELASNTRRRFCPQSRKSKRKLYKGIITYQWTTGTSTKEFLPFFSLSVEI